MENPIKKTLALLVLALSAVAAPITLTAQEAPITIQTNVGTGYNCGRVSSPLYCYGIPVTIAGVPSGTFWLDTYTTGYNAGTGFILWNDVADLGEGNVTSNVPTKNSAGQVTKLVVNFSGDTTTGEPYDGVLTLTFSYYYSSGGGGRGGAGAGWRFLATGGSAKITYR